MTILWYIAFGLPIFGVGMYWVAVVLTLGWMAYIRWSDRRASSYERPGITIFKPLAGLDEELAINLESFAQLDYEKLQIIFASARDDDPALQVARALARRHPQLDILILSESDSPAINPKVRLLELMLPHAKHPWCLISDSNVRVEPDDLKRLSMRCRHPKVGLVYQPVVGIGETTGPAAIENIRLSESAGLLTIGAKLLFFQDVVMGKGMLMRRAALADIGDFASVRDVLAEDYLLGKAIGRAGWKCTPGNVPARAVHVNWSWRSLKSRHLRHASMRCRLEAWAYPLEVFFNPMITALVPLCIGGWWGVALFAWTVASMATLDICTSHLLRKRPLAWKFVPLMPVKDALIFWLWIRAIFNNTVSWRGRTYRIRYGTRLELVAVEEPVVVEQPIPLLQPHAPMTLTKTRFARRPSNSP